MTMNPINPNTTKVEQSFFPLSLKPSSPTSFPLSYSDNIWDIVRENTAVFTIAGQIGQYTQHDVNEMVAQYVAGIVESLDLGCLYMGIAVTSTTPETGAKGFYFALTDGTYANFLTSGGTAITVAQGEIAALVRSGNAWTKQHIMIRPYIDPVSKHWIVDGQDSGIVAEGVDGESAYEVWLDAGNQGTEQDFLNSLKATVGAFKPVDYDSNAPSVIGGTASTVSGVTASAATKDVIVLMPNAASDPTATRMYVTNEVAASPVSVEPGEPATDSAEPTTYQFVYIGELSVDLRFASGQSLNNVRLVNDTSTGGVNDVLTAEQGKVLKQEITQLDQKVFLSMGGNIIKGYKEIDLSQLTTPIGSFSTAFLTAVGKSYEIPVASLESGTKYIVFNYLLPDVGSYAYVGFSNSQVSAVTSNTDIANTNLLRVDKMSLGVNAVEIPDTINGQVVNYIYIVYYRSSGIYYIDSLGEASSFESMADNFDDKLSVLDQKFKLQDYHFFKTQNASTYYTDDFGFLPIGTVIVNYGNPIRVYSDNSTYETIPGFEEHPNDGRNYGGYKYTVSYPIVKFLVSGSGNADFIINPSTDVLQQKTIISEDVFTDRVYILKDAEYTTTAGTAVNILGTNPGTLPIPKGSKVLINISPSDKVGTTEGCLIKEWTLAKNGSNWVTDVRTSILSIVANEDISALRITVPASHVIGNGTITVTCYIDKIGDKIKPIIDANYPVITRDTLVEYAKYFGCYDEINDVFIHGTSGYFVIPNIDNYDTMGAQQMMASFFARYTSLDANKYPEVALGNRYGPLNQSYYRANFKYVLGEKDYYKLVEVTNLPLIKATTTSSNAYLNQVGMLEIWIPEGVTLEIKYFKYIPVTHRNPGFKVFHHGSDYDAEMDTREQWNFWKFSNPYGVIVVPKKCASGEWVCWHDDGVLSDSPVRLKGGSALPSDIAAKMITELTWTEIQNLEYSYPTWWDEYPGIPLVDDWFAECAKQGMHPCLSLHSNPNYSNADFEEIKAMAMKYGLLDKLTLKGSLNAERAAQIFSVFGNSIESYFPNAQISPENADILYNAGFDQSKVVLGLEKIVNGTDRNGDAIGYGWIPDETALAYLQSKGIYWGLAPVFTNPFDGAWIQKAIKAGMYEFTNDTFNGNGLAW